MKENNSKSEAEVKTSQQSKTFHDFVFGKGNAERLWKIVDEIAKYSFNYWAEKSGFNKVEPASNYNAVTYFISILTSNNKMISGVDNNLAISDKPKQMLLSMYKTEIDNNKASYDSDTNEKLFSQEIKKFSSDDQQILKSVFDMSWYNKIRNYCYPNGAPQGEYRKEFFEYIKELLKCMAVIDILSAGCDDCIKITTDNEDDFEAAIKSYFLEENRIKDRLYFIASKSGCEKYDDKKDFIAQFFQAYIDYRLRDQENKKTVVNLFVEYNSAQVETLKTEEKNDNAPNIKLIVASNITENLSKTNETNINNEAKQTNNKQSGAIVPKIKWWKNIWFWRLLSLGVTVLNLILMISFINFWFYFIAPLVIFAIVTLVLFFYEPASEEKIKEELEGGEDSTLSQSNRYQYVKVKGQNPHLQSSTEYNRQNKLSHI